MSRTLLIGLGLLAAAGGAIALYTLRPGTPPPAPVRAPTAAETDGEVDIPALLADLEGYFTDEAWPTRNQVITAPMLRQSPIGVGMSPPEFNRLVDELRRVQGFSVVGPGSPQRVGSVTLFVFKEPAQARAFISTLAEMSMENLTVPQAKGLISDLRRSEFRHISSDASRFLSFRLAEEAGGPTIPNTFVRVANGTIVLEVGAIGLDMNEGEIAALLEEVYDRIRVAAGTAETTPSAEETAPSGPGR